MEQTKTDWRRFICKVLIVFLGIFHITSAIWGIPNSSAYQIIHLTPLTIIVILSKPFLPKHQKISDVVDAIISLFLVGALVYVLYDLYAYIIRQGSATQADVVVGFIYILVMLEAGRRATGWILPALAAFFFAQNLFCDKLPSIFHAVPVKLSLLVDYTFMRSVGIFGIPLQTISGYVLLFMIFAALLSQCGAGQFFIDLAQAVTGRSRGGPAKAAVVSSAAFGSISGSAIANVAGTGSITIPLMKETGYDKEFAGAVESVASTGGQFMPPMMGATAFIIAQEIGVPYINLALYALIPALIYFAAVYFCVDFRAGKMNLKPLPPDMLPNLKVTLKNGAHLILPIVIICVLLARGHSAAYSVMLTIFSLIIISNFRKWTRLDGKKILDAICEGVEDTAAISVTCATAGIMIAGITMTGVSLRFTQQIMDLSGGNLFIALLMAAIASMILGMGMVTVAVYVTVAAVMAPSLIKMGVLPMAAHLFVNYYGCLSTITPPVALASFTAAGISGGNPSKTGWIAFRLGISAYIVPFIFVYSPALLMQGAGVLEVISITITALIGCWALAAASEGYMFQKVNILARLLLLVGAVCMMIPGSVTDLIGLALIAVVFVPQKLHQRKLNAMDKGEET